MKIFFFCKSLYDFCDCCAECNIYLDGNFNCKICSRNSCTTFYIEKFVETDVNVNVIKTKG